MGWCGMPRAVMLSKSQGNGVDPLDIIEKYGADALRFSLLHRQRARQRYALFR
jgi:valyl-tRNA synthetase